VCDRLLGKESPDPHVYGVALLLMIVCGFLFGAVLVRRVLHTAAEDSRSDINLLLEEIKSLRRTTAVLNITTEVIESGREAEPAAQKTQSLKRYLLEKMRTWIKNLLEAERDEFLGRG
jgi:hypothetical protein